MFLATLRGMLAHKLRLVLTTASIALGVAFQAVETFSGMTLGLAGAAVLAAPGTRTRRWSMAASRSSAAAKSSSHAARYIRRAGSELSSVAKAVRDRDVRPAAGGQRCRAGS